jgi:hypothetical protein
MGTTSVLEVGFTFLQFENHLGMRLFFTVRDMSQIRINERSGATTLRRTSNLNVNLRESL